MYVRVTASSERSGVVDVCDDGDISDGHKQDILENPTKNTDLWPNQLGEGRENAFGIIGSMPNIVEKIVNRVINPKTQKTNPKLKIPNPKSKSQNPNPKTQRNPKF